MKPPPHPIESRQETVAIGLAHHLFQLGDLFRQRFDPRPSSVLAVERQLRGRIFIGGGKEGAARQGSVPAKSAANFRIVEERFLGPRTFENRPRVGHFGEGRRAVFRLGDAASRTLLPGERITSHVRGCSRFRTPARGERRRAQEIDFERSGRNRRGVGGGEQTHAVTAADTDQLVFEHFAGMTQWTVSGGALGDASQGVVFDGATASSSVRSARP